MRPFTGPLTMRLTPTQIDCIKTTTRQVLGEDARVILFGSRVNDQARGGDVDLYVESDNLALMSKVRCKIKLQDQLELPVDLIVKPHGNGSPIAMIAKLEGIAL